MPTSKIKQDVQIPIELGRVLVHDLATPLATLQLNLQVLSEYLPKLLAHSLSEARRAELSIGESHLQALAEMPQAFANDLQRMRTLCNSFLDSLNAQLPKQMPSEIVVPLSPSCGLGTIRRILLIEDEEIHQAIALKQLAGIVAVDTASSAAAAVKMCAHGSYDLILLDFILPGTESRSLVRSLREICGAEIIIVGLSNMSLHSDQIDSGLNGYLAKPLRLEQLRAVLAGTSMSL